MSENGDLNDPLPPPLPPGGRNRTPACGVPTREGSPCTSPGMMGDGRCFVHSDVVAPEAKTLAVRRGGLARRPTLPEARDPRLATTGDIRRFCELTAGRVTRGELHPELAKVSLEAATTALKVIEVEKVERRLLELEALAVGEEIRP